MPKQLLSGEAKIKNERQELFAVLYAGIATKHYFGNGRQCYLHAYGGEERLYEIEEKIARTFDGGKLGETERRKLKSEKRSIENTATVNASRLLMNANVARRVAYLFDRYLSDDYMDREMAYVIGQRDELIPKVAAYREVAKVKERIRGAGALTGSFEFGWMDDDGKTGTSKKIVLKKARVTATSAEDDDVDPAKMTAEFAQ